MDNDLVIGDRIVWLEPVFEGSFRNPRCVGERTIEGVIERKLYGRTTGQHTFSLRVLAAEGVQALAVGSLIRRMGRNLYGRLVEHVEAVDSERARRAASKHTRGDAVRTARAAEEQVRVHTNGRV